MSSRQIVCWLAAIVISAGPCSASEPAATRADGRIDSHVWDMLYVEEACAAYQDAMSGCGGYESARKHVLESAAVTAITANSIEVARYTEEEKFIQQLLPPPLRLHAGSWTCDAEVAWQLQTVIYTTAIYAIRIGDCQVAVAMARLLLSHSRAFGMLPLAKDDAHRLTPDQCAIRAIVLLRYAAITMTDCVADGWNAMLDHQIQLRRLHADQHRQAVHQRHADALFPPPSQRR